MSDTATNNQPREFAGFFENARKGRISFPYCLSCGRFHWYPMPRCPHCRSQDIEWRKISGRGQLYSFTRVMHPFDKSRADRLPYIVALVTFSDAPGINFITNIVGSDTDQLHIGQFLSPVFRTDDCGQPIIEFQAA